jgi:hypothetical protein
VTETCRARWLLLALLTATACSSAFGCSKKVEAPSAAERQLATSVGIEARVVVAARGAGEHLRRLQGFDSERGRTPGRGLTIDVPSASAQTVARELRRTAGRGYVVFISEQSFGIGDKPDSVSIVKTADPMEVVRLMGTDGANYDLDNAAVIARLRQWDTRYGLILTGAGPDWMQADFRHPPRDMRAFAQEVYRLCPDVVDQGTESVEALAAEMTRTNSVYLWWD